MPDVSIELQAFHGPVICKSNFYLPILSAKIPRSTFQARALVMHRILEVVILFQDLFNSDCTAPSGDFFDLEE